MAGASAIDRYRLVRRIKPRLAGEAGGPCLRFGEVWLAEDVGSATDRQVVLKHTGSKEIYPDIVRLLRDEQLSHAYHIVPLLDYIVESGEVVAVTPYLPDGTLADALDGLRIKSATERVAVATRLLHAMAKALAWLHSENAENADGITIVHNDLKPDNIFLSDTDFLLGDFDNTLIHKPQREGGNPDGAAAKYAPPERFDKGFTVQGDYWSLGLVLAEVLLGHHPFDSGDGRRVLQFDSANLPHDWQLGSDDFLALPREWQALLYGLTTTRTDARWKAFQLRQWLSADEGVRQAVIEEGLELGDSKNWSAGEPYLIGGAPVRRVEAAAEEILRCDPAPDVADPAALADWVEHQCNRSGVAGQIRHAAEIEDFEERRLRVALALDRHCPLTWRRKAISGRQIADVARNETDDSHDWIESLRSNDPLAIYAASGNTEATTIRAEIYAAQANLDDAWREMRDAGCPLDPPDVAALWRIACQTAFSPNLRPHYLELLKHLDGAVALFARPAWLNRWCGRLDELSVEQLLVINHAETQMSLDFDRLMPVKAEAILLSEGSDEELRARPIIWLETQERLLGKMRVSDIARPDDLQGGQFYPDAMAQLPYFRLRNWLRQTLYPWARRRLGRDPASRLRRSGVVGDHFNEAPLLHLSATLYQTQSEVEGLVQTPTNYACEVRWHAPEGYDVRLVLTRPRLFRDTLLWKTPMQSWVRRCLDFVFTSAEGRSTKPSGLSRIGRIALSVCQTMAVTLVAEPRVPLRFRPSYASEPIIIVLPKSELTLRRPLELHQYKPKLIVPDHPITRLRSALRPIEGEIRKSYGIVGANRGRTAAMFWDRLRIKPLRGLPRFAGPLVRFERWFSGQLGSRHRRRGRTWMNL